MPCAAQGCLTPRRALPNLHGTAVRRSGMLHQTHEPQTEKSHRLPLVERMSNQVSGLVRERASASSQRGHVQSSGMSSLAFLRSRIPPRVIDDLCYPRLSPLFDPRLLFFSSSPSTLNHGDREYS